MRVRDLERVLESGGDGKPHRKTLQAYKAALGDLFRACRDALDGVSEPVPEKAAGYVAEGWRSGV